MGKIWDSNDDARISELSRNLHDYREHSFQVGDPGIEFKEYLEVLKSYKRYQGIGWMDKY